MQHKIPSIATFCNPTTRYYITHKTYESLPPLKSYGPSKFHPADTQTNKWINISDCITLVKKLRTFYTVYSAVDPIMTYVTVIINYDTFTRLRFARDLWRFTNVLWFDLYTAGPQPIVLNWCNDSKTADNSIPDANMDQHLLYCQFAAVSKQH